MLSFDFYIKPFFFCNTLPLYLVTLFKKAYKKSKWILIGIIYWASSIRLNLLVKHVVEYIKLDVQKKLFAIMTFIGFIGLYRISTLQYLQLLDKKVALPGPDIPVYPGVTFFLFFFLFLSFPTQNHEEASCFTEDHST